MKFLFDENISPYLVDLMRRAGSYEVTSVHAQNWRGIKDDQLVPRAVSAGFVFVSLDRRIGTTEALAATLQSSQNGAIFLGQHYAKFGLWNQCDWMFRYWPRVHEAFVTRPGVYTADRVGKLKAYVLTGPKRSHRPPIK